MTRPRRLLVAVVALLVGALALSGCLYAAIPAEPPRPTATAAPDTDGVPEDLVRFYGQDLAWSDCAAGFECATVTAPLDWDDPSAGEIDLAITRHRADDGRPLGSLLVNPGGPGASGVSLIQSSLEFAVGERLVASYDVVGFDPRGVGESTAVQCLDDAGMDAFLFDLPDAPRASAAWTADLTQANQGFADACEANSGGILPYITTVQAARDLDLLRAVLGDPELDYLGYSYGTDLGATYAELYPDKVGRMVLDGALDPSVPSWAVSAVQLGGFQAALEDYLAVCLAEDDCPFRGTVDQALDDLATLLATVDASPLEASDGRLLNADGLLQAIITALYSETNWSFLTGALTDVLQGEADTAFVLVDYYYDRQDGVYLNNSTEAFYAYICMDSPPSTAEDDALFEAEVTRRAPLFAPYSTGPDFCATWPYPPTGEVGPVAAEGTGPIVVIGTTGDPATPYEWAVSLADQLSDGVLITLEGEGHTGYNKGVPCVDDAVVAYFLDDVVPEDGLTCG